MTTRQREGAQRATDAFFGQLAGQSRQPLLKSASGTLRFDLTDGGRVEHWLVTMQHGEVTVSRRAARADAVVTLDKATFDGMVSGRVNAIAAALRGDLAMEGDVSLVILFQRLFPSPPGTSTSHRSAGAEAHA